MSMSISTRYLSYTQSYPERTRPRILPNRLPYNVALRELARGLAEAHEAYKQPKCVLFPHIESGPSVQELLTILSLSLSVRLSHSHSHSHTRSLSLLFHHSSKILFVVQDPERNAFDQRELEWELLEK
jgi:hypothetical protein